jgi:2-polyprenyl-3-methyl-5-hydroxy-6-metoxy-1,4-benzoquinol methylase
MGLLLQAFRQDGWDVHGIDPDRNACRYATRSLGLPTTPGTLESARLPASHADAFVMLHVIEHVPDPQATLREVHRVLKPGGTLVLETPRYDTLAFKLLGRRERSLGCDGHIYFFTNDSLSRMCRAAGFEILRHDAVGRTLTLDRMAYNVGVVSRSRRVQAALGRWSRALRLQTVRLRLNLRDMQRLILRKPS